MTAYFLRHSERFQPIATYTLDRLNAPDDFLEYLRYSRVPQAMKLPDQPPGPIPSSTSHTHP